MATNFPSILLCATRQGPAPAQTRIQLATQTRKIMSKIMYRGVRTDVIPAVTKEQDGYSAPLDPAPSLKVRNHSPTGFEWGYAGSGPAQLALALLMDAFEMEFAPQNGIVGRQYQDFKFEVVCRMPREGWELSQEEIQQWANGDIGPDYFASKWPNQS